MAAGDVTPARRIPLPPSGDINDVMWDLQPGDYCGPVKGYTADRAAVFMVLPDSSGIRHCASPPHVFRECADGSLEIRESILAMDSGWHGYLDEGNTWREV